MTVFRELLGEKWPRDIGSAREVSRPYYIYILRRYLYIETPPSFVYTSATWVIVGLGYGLTSNRRYLNQCWLFCLLIGYLGTNVCESGIICVHFIQENTFEKVVFNLSFCPGHSELVHTTNKTLWCSRRRRVHSNRVTQGRMYVHSSPTLSIPGGLKWYSIRFKL